MANLGLVPGQPDSSSDLWATFLGGRYRTIADLNTAYGTGYTDFSQVPFPSALPSRSNALWDWYQFQGILLIDSTAHQFTVLLPIKPADAQNLAAQRAKLELVQRVIDLGETSPHRLRHSSSTGHSSAWVTPAWDRIPCSTWAAGRRN